MTRPVVSITRTISLNSAKFFFVNDSCILTVQNPTATISDAQLTNQELQVIESGIISGYINSDNLTPHSLCDIFGDNFIQKSHLWTPEDNDVLLNGASQNSY